MKIFEDLRDLNINYSLIRKITGLIFCILFSAIIVSYDFLHLGNISAGEVVPVNIKAPYDIKFFDREATDRIEKQAEQRIEKVYSEDESVKPEVIADITGFLLSVEEKRKPESNDKRISDLFESFRKIEGFRIAQLRPVINELAANILDGGYKKEEHIEIFDAVSRKIQKMDGLSEDEKGLVKRVLITFVRPNFFFDREKTDNLIRNIKSSIRPVERFIQKGEIIAREGDILDDTAIDLLSRTGYFDESKSFFQRFAGYMLLFIFFSLILILYLHHFNADILSEEPLVLFVELVAFLAVSGFRFYDVILRSRVDIFVASQKLPVFSIYLLPVASIAILVSLVVDSKFAILLSSMLSVVGGLIFRDINFVVISNIGCIVSVYTIMSAKTRAEQLLSGLYLIVTNISLIAALHFINLRFLTLQQDIKFLLRDILHGFFNGAFSIIVALGTMPVFEKLFRVTSALRLLELTDLNNKLLKTLLEQAPGTYHHSIMVANLAEAAAIEIGADSLLARIGGYYHDIGKIKRPFFFVENLMGKDNQHENLSPNLSAIIIISHAKDGVEIARKHNLPEEITDIIQQHHGTTLVKYFYEKARNETGDSVKESSYRYPGPKPQTREAALVMLADSIESATRSLTTATPSSIDNLVRKITNDKFIDEQFDECNLTLKEIEKIRNVFSKVLLQMFHKRIEYPDTEIEGQKIFK